MKRFIKMLCWFLPFVILFVGFNVLVDPTNLVRGGKLIDEIYSIMASGQNARFTFENYNDRALAQKLALERTSAPDTIVLGSSRGIQITSEMVGGSLANHCVTGGMLDDMGAFWEMYLQSGELPKRAVLSLDLWHFFDIYSEQQRASLVYPEYYNAFYIERMGLDIPALRRDVLSTPKELLSGSYFQLGVAALKKGGIDTSVSPTVADADESATVIRADGSFSYPTSYEFPGADAVFERAKAELPSALDMFSMDSFDETRLLMFEALVDSLLENGVEVVIYISPYHPFIVEAIHKNPTGFPAFSMMQDYVRSFCAARGIALIGSLDPADCALENADFVDSLHLNRNGVEKLTAPLRAGS